MQRSTRPTAHAGALFTRNYIIMVVLYLFCCLFGQSMMAAIPAMMKASGFTEFISGTVVSLFPLSSMLFRRPAGKLAAWLPPKQTLLFCFLILVLSGIAFPNIDLLFQFYPLRIAQGISICLIGVVLGNLVADTIPPERFDEGMGYYSIGVPAMSFLGPAVSRILVAEIGYRLMLYILSAITAVALPLCLLSTLKNTNRTAPAPAIEASHTRLPLLERCALPASFMLLATVLAHSCIVSFLPLYAQQTGLPNTVPFYLAAAVGILAIRLSATLFHIRFPERTAVPLAYAICIVSMLLVPTFHLLPSAVLLGGLYGMAIGILQPYYIAKALLAAPPGRRNLATVTYYIFMDVGYASGGLLWGYVAQYLGYSSVFFVAIFVNLCGLVAWFLLSHRSLEWKKLPPC